MFLFLIFMLRVLSLCLCRAHSFFRVTQQSNHAMPAAGGKAAPERVKMANGKIKLQHMCHILESKFVTVMLGCVLSTRP